LKDIDQNHFLGRTD